MLVYLKVKIKSLAAEARVIRTEENKALSRARAFKGKYRKRHDVESHKPEKPAWVLRFEKYGEAKETSETEYEKFWGLKRHRINVVRKEARDSHIAYGFLRGREYQNIEQSRYIDPDWKNIERIVLRFNSGDIEEQVILQRFAEWLENAKATPRIGA